MSILFKESYKTKEEIIYLYDYEYNIRLKKIYTNLSKLTFFDNNCKDIKVPTNFKLYVYGGKEEKIWNNGYYIYNNTIYLLYHNDILLCMIRNKKFV